MNRQTATKAHQFRSLLSDFRLFWVKIPLPCSIDSHSSYVFTNKNVQSRNLHGQLFFTEIRMIFQNTKSTDPATSQKAGRNKQRDFVHSPRIGGSIPFPLVYSLYHQISVYESLMFFHSERCEEFSQDQKRSQSLSIGQK